MSSTDVVMRDAPLVTLNVDRWGSAFDTKGKAPHQGLSAKVPRWVYDYAQRLEAEIRHFNTEFTPLFADVQAIKQQFPQLAEAYEGIVMQQNMLYDTVQNDVASLANTQSAQFSEMVAATTRFSSSLDTALTAVKTENDVTKAALIQNAEQQAKHTGEIVSKIKELIQKDTTRTVKLAKLEKELKEMRRKLAKQEKRDKSVALVIESIQSRLKDSEAVKDLKSLAASVKSGRTIKEVEDRNRPPREEEVRDSVAPDDGRYNKNNGGANPPPRPSPSVTGS